mgnify:CR=1 FL=1
MVLRVVSLPPTISRMMLPIRLSGSMCRVASLCAIIDSRSLRGGALTRSFQSLEK